MPENRPALLLDTSTRSGVVLLGDERQNLYLTESVDPGQTHGRDLIPAIQRLVQKSGFQFHDISRLAVGIGPGSYTGLRVGLAVIKTLAEVIDCPVLPIDSLLLPVLNLPDQVLSAVSIADAQRGAVYATLYRRKSSADHWVSSEKPAIVAWADLDHWVNQPETVVTGPGLSLIQRLGPISANVAKLEHAGPEVNGLKIWLQKYMPDVQPVDRQLLEPLYIRPSAAEEKRNAGLAQQSN